MKKNEFNDDKEKLKKEIEELLNEIDDLPSNRKNKLLFLCQIPLKLIKKTLSGCIYILKNILNKITLQQLFLISVAMIFFSIFFRRMYIVFSNWLFVFGSIVFVISFAGLTLFKRENAKEKYWRGRMIKYQNESFIKKLLKFINYKKH